ncbi:MAG: 50S ribosomal protein L23 [Bacillales bacterium]|nr:50S ribosomal protein L23 [Bacillales bacterium]
MISYDIIKKPIITEKSMKLVEKNKYTFEVAKNATKTEVKAAVEEIFNVKVEDVNIINTLPKRKKVGKYTGFLPAVQKAIVTLQEGDKIEIYSK